MEMVDVKWVLSLWMYLVCVVTAHYVLQIIYHSIYHVTINVQKCFKEGSQRIADEPPNVEDGISRTGRNSG